MNKSDKHINVKNQSQPTCNGDLNRCISTQEVVHILCTDPVHTGRKNVQSIHASILYRP